MPFILVCKPDSPVRSYRRMSFLEAVARDGRARWKVENENNNALKTKGYHLEHDFGHGHEHRTALLLSFNLVAFLFHTILGRIDEHYGAVRKKLGTRRTFFQDLDALLRYLDFPSWEDVLTFMDENLQLDSGWTRSFPRRPSGPAVGPIVARGRWVYSSPALTFGS